MTEEKSTQAPLDGIRVVDLTSFLAGPYCTRLLADAGAEVIKIEQPAGDLIRSSAPMAAGHSRYFGHMNCGKKSVTLNLKAEAGRADFFKLIAGADILVENFRPGVMARLGFSFDEVSAVNPKLIYCSISGYGQNGSDSHRPAFAPIIHAASGFDMVQFGYLNGALDKPMRNRNTAADVLASAHAYGAITTALFHRQRTGDGQYIDVAMIDCLHNMMGVEFQIAQSPDDDIPLVFAPVRTSDGFLMVAPVSQANFTGFAKAAGHEEWLTDPRFAQPTARRQNYDALLAEAEHWSLDQTAADAEEALLAAGCPCSRYLTVGESLSRPAIAERGAVVEVTDAGGSYLVANTPFRFSHAKVGVRPQVPGVGEHNKELGVGSD